MLAAMKDWDGMDRHTRQGWNAGWQVLNRCGWAPRTEEERIVYLILNRDWDGCAKYGAAAVEPLIDALKHPQQWVKKGAAGALGKLGDLAVEALVGAMQDADVGVRRRVAVTLGEMGEARGVGPLVKALQDSDKLVRYNSALALGRIGDQRAVQPLRQAAAKESDAYAKSAIDRALLALQ